MGLGLGLGFGFGFGLGLTAAEEGDEVGRLEALVHPRLALGHSSSRRGGPRHARYRGLREADHEEGGQADDAAADGVGGDKHKSAKSKSMAKVREEQAARRAYRCPSAVTVSIRRKRSNS